MELKTYTVAMTHNDMCTLDRVDLVRWDGFVVYKHMNYAIFSSTSVLVSDQQT